jgi:hypothetical protein
MEPSEKKPITPLPEPGARFELHFDPSARLINEVYGFIASFYQRVLGDGGGAGSGRIAMVTHELLENTVKYSLDGQTALAIAVIPTDDGRRLHVEIRNRAAPGHLARVRRFFAELRAAPDAFHYFQALMHHGSPSDDGAGLGLARIAAEGEMMLDYEIVGDQLAIVAECVEEEDSTPC